MTRAIIGSRRIAKLLTPTEQLDKVVEKIMRDREGKLPQVDTRIAALLRIAAELRNLPNEEFKMQLKRDLAARAAQGRTTAPPEPEIASHQRPGSIMPFMYNDDVLKAFELYRKVFGAAEVHRVTQPGGRVSHVQMAIGQTHVMLRDATTPDLAEYRAQGFAGTPRAFGGTPLHLYIYVADADAAFKRAIDSGAKVLDPMADQPWGDRCGGVQDPFGYIWYIATPLKTI